MSAHFELTSTDDEEDDDYWKNSGKNKFNKAIFSDSDSENEPKNAPAVIEPNDSLTGKDFLKKEIVQESTKFPIRPQLQKLTPNEETTTTGAGGSIGKSFLHMNPVSNRAFNENSNRSNTEANNDTSINSTTSSNSSVTFNSEYSARSRLIEVPRHHTAVPPPVPRPKFTMPSTIIQSSAFSDNRSKETAPIFNLSKEQPTQLQDNSNILKENLELKTRKSKLEAELKLLTSKLDDKPDFKNTINRILLDKTYWFDLYKSKRDKIQLLKEAIESNDGNAILAVALFIKRTLTPDSFHSILINNPTALNQYIFHLEQMEDTDQLAAFYKYHGNLNESATIKYFKPILCDRNQELSDKTQLIHEFEKSHTSVEVTLINNSNSTLSTVSKYLKLLQVQRDILKNNSAFLRKDIIRQNAMDALKQSSLSNTVSFCLKFNRELNDNDSYSIENLKKEFDLSTKQFSIWFIKSMSEIGAWTELEQYTKQRGIFNMVKNPPTSYETIVFVISHVKGPAEQIKKYLSLIENINRRQTLAMKFKQSDVVIETFRIQRDKVGLFNYRNMFRENTPDYIKANIVIMDHTVKWKN